MEKNNIQHKIYIGDCVEVMKSLKNESVDLVITSPPYNVGKDYGVIKEDMELPEYEKFTHDWIKETYRLLKPTGKLCLNVSATDKNQIDELHCKICKEIGFKCIEKIIWIKSFFDKSKFIIGKRNQSFYNEYGKLRMCYEPVIVFEKPSSTCKKSKIKPFVPESWKYNVWFIPPVKDRTHPAPFPKEIPKRLITFYSQINDVVLDPFSGTGTTIKVASELKRNSIGCELNPFYTELTRRRKILGLKILSFRQ
jgi:site-specific DNA-methyltransferase (adenine-specific)